MDKQELVGTLKDSLRRVFRSNFQREKATDKEREILAASTPAVTHPLAQDYAAWRRALLYFGAIALIAWSVIELATYQEAHDKFQQQALKQIKQLPAYERDAARENMRRMIRMFGRSNLEVIDNVLLIIKFAVIVGAVFLLLAARNWNHLRKSRRWARMAFYIIFLTPFVLAAIPFTSMMEFGHLNASEKKSVMMLLGAELGFRIFLVVGPRALALMPGMIRSSVTLKTLIPESPLTGWMATIMGTLYPIFLIVVVAAINQTTGDVKLVGGIVCLIIAPMIYLVNAKEIMRPHKADQVEGFVSGVRKKSMIFNVVGVFLLALFVLDLEFFTIGDCFRFLFGLIGNFLLVTLVASDLLLALMHAGHQQTSEFKGTDLAKDLEKKFAALREVGLTDIKTVEEEKTES